MTIVRYKDNYGLPANFLAYRQYGNFLFIQELFSYPINKKRYNIGVWKLKTKRSN